jgi:hypothetical protein
VNRRRLLLAPLVMALALGTAACGSPSGAGAEVASADGSGGTAEVKDAAARKVDAEKAGLEFAKCMREHGVDVPDPQSGGDGFIMVSPAPGEVAAGESTAGGPVDGQALPEEFRAADEACRHFLDDLIQDGGPRMDAEAQDRALAFAKCMREHGIDMPDPDFSGGGGGFSIQIGGGDGDGDGERIDPRSQVFQDAQKACGSLFGPEGSPGPAGGGPGGGTFSSSSGAVSS